MGWSLPANPIPKKIQRRLEYILKVATVKTFHIEIAALAMMVLGGTFLSGNEVEGIGIERMVVPIPTSEQSMTRDGEHCG